MGFQIKNYKILIEENFLEKSLHHIVNISFTGFNRFSSTDKLVGLAQKVFLSEIRYQAPHLGLHEGCKNRVDINGNIWNYSGEYIERIPIVEVDLFLKAFSADARNHYGGGFDKGVIQFAGAAVMFIPDTHVDAYELVSNMLDHYDKSIKGSHRPETRNMFIKFQRALQIFTAQHIGKEVYQRAEKIRLL